MVVEYIRYAVPVGQSREFEPACHQAAEALDASPHCQAYELSRCLEDPTHYVVRIEWDSVEGHEQGFRKSEEFQRSVTAVRPFVSEIEEMRHYDTLLVSSPSGSEATALSTG